MFEILFQGNIVSKVSFLAFQMELLLLCYKNKTNRNMKIKKEQLIIIIFVWEILN